MSDWPFHIRMRMLINRLLKIVGLDYIHAHKNCSRHRNEIQQSERCGWFYCLESFTPSEIQEWVDGDATAMCPRCGIDSVTGSASVLFLSQEFLQRDAPLLVRAHLQDQGLNPRA